MDEFVEYLASVGIRRIPDEDLELEIDYAIRERDLATIPQYKEYQVTRIHALGQEKARRKSISKAVKKSGLTMEFVRDLKALVDIRDIFNWMGVLVTPNGTRRETYACPAHPDKHPSGVIYVDDQQYHCFQCNAHGDVFDALMAFRGMAFKDAVDVVASYYGMELPKPPVRGFKK